MDEQRCTIPPPLKVSMVMQIDTAYRQWFVDTWPLHLFVGFVKSIATVVGIDGSTQLFRLPLYVWCSITGTHWPFTGAKGLKHAIAWPCPCVYTKQCPWRHGLSVSEWKKEDVVWKKELTSTPLNNFGIILNVCVCKVFLCMAVCMIKHTVWSLSLARCWY